MWGGATAPLRVTTFSVKTACVDVGGCSSPPPCDDIVTTACVDVRGRNSPLSVKMWMEDSHSAGLPALPFLPPSRFYQHAHCERCPRDDANVLAVSEWLGMYSMRCTDCRGSLLGAHVVALACVLVHVCRYSLCAQCPHCATVMHVVHVCSCSTVCVHVR
jgi:hypothetical protein